MCHLKSLIFNQLYMQIETIADQIHPQPKNVLNEGQDQNKKNSCYCMFSLLHLRFDFYGKIHVKNMQCVQSVPITFQSFALLSVAKVSLSQCSRALLLQSYSLSKPKANFLRKNQLSLWDRFSETKVRRIHSLFKLVLTPVST